MYAGTLYREYLTEKLGSDAAVAKHGDVPAIRARNQVVVSTVPASAHAKSEQFMWQRIVVQCWSMDEDSTAALCFRIRGHVLRSKREIPTVHNVRIVGEPGKFDDPDDTSPRFQMVFDALFKTIPLSFPAAM